MPTADGHLAAYEQNLRTAAGLATANPRWAAVAAFYAAVHLVEALAARDGVHNRRHVGTQSRELYLSAHPHHHVILSELTALRAASEIARYDTPEAFDAAYPGDVVPAQLIGGCLSRAWVHAASAGLAATNPAATTNSPLSVGVPGASP